MYAGIRQVPNLTRSKLLMFLNETWSVCGQAIPSLIQTVETQDRLSFVSYNVHRPGLCQTSAEIFGGRGVGSRVVKSLGCDARGPRFESR